MASFASMFDDFVDNIKSFFSNIFFPKMDAIEAKIDNVDAKIDNLRAEIRAELLDAIQQMRNNTTPFTSSTISIQTPPPATPHNAHEEDKYTEIFYYDSVYNNNNYIPTPQQKMEEADNISRHIDSIYQIHGFHTACLVSFQKNISLATAGHVMRAEFNNILDSSYPNDIRYRQDYSFNIKGTGRNNNYTFSYVAFDIEEKAYNHPIFKKRHPTILDYHNTDLDTSFKYIFYPLATGYEQVCPDTKIHLTIDFETDINALIRDDNKPFYDAIAKTLYDNGRKVLGFPYKSRNNTGRYVLTLDTYNTTGEDNEVNINTPKCVLAVNKERC
jgi:hypothetical protein